MKEPTRRNIAMLIIIAVIFISIALGIAVVLRKLSDLDARKGYIISYLSKALNREVSYERLAFSFHLSPAFIISGIEIKERNGRDTFATIEQINSRVAVLPLLLGKIVFKEIHLEKPAVMLYRDRDGNFNINDLLASRKEASAVEIKRIIVNHGAITFSDHGVIPSGLTTNLDDIDIDIDYPVLGKVIDLNISASVNQQGKKGTISIAGNISTPDGDGSLADSSIDAKINAAGLSIEWYRPYYEEHNILKKMTGVMNIDSHIRGDRHQFSSEGSVAIKSLSWQYPELFDTALTPKDVNLSYKMQRTPSEIVTDTFDLTVDDVKISGRYIIKDIDTNDPLITAEMSSSPIPLEKFGPLIPYGMISKGVADFIKTHIKGGTYQLKEGSLNGRLSQIAHMDEKENYNVLHIKVGVDEGLFSWSKNVPIVSGIKGELELRGKDFLLHNMSGKFGESPMTLEGRITDYCLATPSSYPFTMTITPGQKEIAWLLGIHAYSKFAFAGKSSLQMTGSGRTNNYTLDGRWDLTDASYGYSDIFTKPQSQGNRLVFKSNFKADKVQVESFSYQLASLTVNATGLYRIKDRYVSSFAVNSNPFQIEELATNLPRIGKYQPRGRIQLDLTGSGTPKSIADLGWRGTITFSEVSFKPTETVKAISALSGSVSLKKNGLDTSPLVGRIGGSLIQGRATLKDFKNPSVSVNVSSALLDLKDLGLQNPSGAIKLKDFAGNIVFRDNGLQIRRLSAQVNDSFFNVTGTMPDVKKPFFDIRITSSYLDMDDIILLSRTNAPKKKKSEGLSLKVSVQSDKGKINRISYSGLRTTLTYRQRTLDITAFEMKAFNGGFSGTGHIVFPPGGVMRCQAGFTVNKMSAEQILKYAGSETVPITGTLTMKGDVTAEGATIPDLKKTAQGTATLVMEKGSLQSSKDKINRIPYSEIRTTLTYRQQTIDITTLEMKAFKGGFSGTGHIVLSPDGLMRCEMGFTIAKMSAEQILKYAGSETVTITGALTMKGDVTAEGATISDLKKTARGTATLMMEEGSLKGFVGLSKVFSILNVSQLLSFKLQDEMTDGMPYKSIKGTFSLKDGILTTKDLFVNSSAMNISSVGKADIIREEVDTTIGIRPLQTVDKVVSKIPIVGWVLTDDKKSLITVYFKAQGKWSNPTVDALPVHSMDKGVLDIFKRVFQLPEKLITDTGEVIMGR